MWLEITYRSKLKIINLVVLVIENDVDKIIDKTKYKQLNIIRFWKDAYKEVTSQYFFFLLKK